MAAKRPRAARKRGPGLFRRHPRLVRGVLLTLAFATALGLGVGYAAWALVCRTGACPSVDALEVFTPRQTSKLYAADGRFLAEIGLERRTLVKLGEVPEVVRSAFVITEDKRFYQHSGIDWRRVGGAVVHDVRSLSLAQGFSTITMQLARNVFPEALTREKTIVRKLKEAKVAREIEDKYTKDKILELYLNQINLGNGAYGVETASQRYFGKSVRDLNIAEAATLAALPKAPERYNPRRYPDRAVGRRNTVIELMRRNGAISDADANLAKSYPMQLARKSEAGDVAPYFVEWVRQQLDQQFGKRLYTQGLKIYTTLDYDMQSAAERALEAQVRAIEGGKFGKYPHLTYEQYLAGKGNGDAASAGRTPYLQGAFIAMDPRTGAVRALVGGRDFADSKFNRATQALRQPGSTFKPIVYSTAIQSGRTTSYILDDSPLSIPQSGGGSWQPQNYDLKFEGGMALRRALYLSRNVPTIRLGMELGESAVIEEARRFGITTPIPAFPSIHIGAADVYPIEMVAAYTAFANLGVRSAPNAILRVETQSGEVLWEPQPVRATVMSTSEAWIMVDIMKDVVQHGTAFNAVWDAGFHVPSGGKTGTTNDGTDVWYIGYTADLVAGVWMGFDKPDKIKANAQGGVLAAPAWTQFMTEVYRRKPEPPDWPRPEAVITRDIDRASGTLISQACAGNPSFTEFFIAGTEPTTECDTPVVPDNPFAVDSGALAPADGGPARVAPGAAPVPQASRPGARPPRDTANPFRLPPR